MMNHKKTLLAMSLLAAMTLQTGCGSSEIVGDFKVHRDACIASQGQYKLDKNGKDECWCYYNASPTPVICSGDEVCDATAQACSRCSEEDSFCNDGKIHICVNSQWQEQSCPTGACAPDRKKCSAVDNSQIEPPKEICCSATTEGTDEYKACINNKDKKIDPKTIVKYVNGVPVIVPCAIGCSEIQEDGKVKYECSVCNDNNFKDRCEQETDDKGNQKAELTQCENGYEIKSKCRSDKCKVVSENEKSECDEITDCSIGMTRCLKKEDNYKQEYCNDKKVWVEMMEVMCHSDLGCNSEKTACVQAECAEGEYKCNNKTYYACQNKKWVKQDNNDKCKDKASVIIQCEENDFKCQIVDGDVIKQFKCIDQKWVEDYDNIEKCKENRPVEAKCEAGESKCLMGEDGVLIYYECRDGVWTVGDSQNCEAPLPDYGCTEGDYKCQLDSEGIYQFYTCNNNHEWEIKPSLNSKCSVCEEQQYRCVTHNDTGKSELQQCQYGQWIYKKECLKCEKEGESKDDKVCQTDELKPECSQNDCKDDSTLKECKNSKYVEIKCPTQTPVCLNGACVVCKEKTYQCSTDESTNLQKCVNGIWINEWENMSNDEKKCDICENKNGTPTSNLSEICSSMAENEPCEENGLYRLNEKNEIQLCANHQWVEDIPEYNQVLVVEKNESSYLFSVIKNGGEITHNFFVNHDASWSIESIIEDLNNNNWTNIPHWDPDLVEGTPFAYKCVDSIIFGAEYISKPVHIVIQDPDGDFNFGFTPCANGCNSNRTACAEKDEYVENQKFIYMSYYINERYSSIELWKEGEKQVMCKISNGDVEQCNLSDNILKVCFDIYDKNYHKTSYSLARDEEHPETLTPMKTCTDRCDVDWRNCKQ